MTPSARIAAAVELLSNIEAELSSNGAAADSLVQSYFRERRYAGSKDRREISRLVYGLLRERELIIWFLAQVSLVATPKNQILAWLFHKGDALLSGLENPDKYGIDSPDSASIALFQELAKLDPENAPAAAQANLPGWAEEGLCARFNDSWQIEAEALQEHAGFCVRVNPLKLSSDKISIQINSDLEGFEKTSFSRLGYRSDKRLNVTQSKSFKHGLIEVQDEAAQIASLLVGAEAGETVVDFCAGAGGKTLLVGALMQNSGVLHAFDVSKRRLKALDLRAKRAGLKCVTSELLNTTGESREQQLLPYQDVADKVILDVPCSGSGTWRRSPELRWRYDKRGLTELRMLQKRLLEEGAKLVNKGGQLFYMTCSLLPDENEIIVSDFLEERSKSWKVKDFRDNWCSRYLSDEPPITASLRPEYLQLTPAQHHTDGFFIAILERLS